MSDIPTIAPAEPTVEIRLTNTECNHVLQLFDVAVKTAGLQAAHAAMPILAKIQDALKTAIVPASSVPTPPPSRR